MSRYRGQVLREAGLTQRAIVEQAVESQENRPRPLTDGPFLRIFIVYPQGGCMHTKVQKWGNSLGLRIPRSFAAEAQVEEGSTVDISVENGCLHVRPLRARRYLLSDLLKRVSRRNLHPEVSTGEAVGREAW